MSPRAPYLIRFALLLVFLACLTACSDELPTAPTPIDLQFTLAPGQTAPVEAASVGVRFDGVSGDSRCPADAFCVLGGDAIVHIAVLEGTSVTPYELQTGPLQPVRYGDLTLELVRLDPYPFSARPIDPSEYRATLRVTR